MTARDLARLPLLLTLVLALSACSTSLNSTSSSSAVEPIFGSGSDDFEFGIAPSGPIGPSVATTSQGTVVAPVGVTEGAAPAPTMDGSVAPAASTATGAAYDPYAGTNYVGVVSDGTAYVGGSYVGGSYEGYGVPTYPAPTPGYWDSHEEAPPGLEEVVPAPMEGVPAPPPAEYMPELVLRAPMGSQRVGDMSVHELRNALAAPRRVGDMTVDELRSELASGPRQGPRYQARSIPGCNSCNTGGENKCDPCGRDTQVGVFFGIFPGIGMGIEWSREFKTTSTASLMWDVSLVYQDLYDVFDNESLGGKYNALRLGVKAVFAPCSKFHPTVRGGLTWFRASGNPEVISVADFNNSRDEDYIGAYVAVGLDWDITDCVTIGPEIGYVYGYAPGADEWGGTLEARFHMLFRF